jgi:hypothetical protein
MALPYAIGFKAFSLVTQQTLLTRLTGCARFLMARIFLLRKILDK